MASTDGPVPAAAAAARARRALLRLLSLAGLLLAWEIAGRIPVNLAFPTFTATAAAFANMIADGSLPAAALKTVHPLLIGLAFSALVGIALGVAMGLSRVAEWLVAPPCIVMQAAPMAALIPLVTFVYGIGLMSKVVAVVILALPVIALNSYKAVRNVSPSLLAMCRVFQGTRRQAIFKIVLPAASPVILAGLRLGVGAGFVGIVLAELLITPVGIGDLITFHRSVANYPEMYATIASIIATSALVLAGLEAIETRLFRPERRSARP